MRRFSIRSLMALVLLPAIGLAALRNRSLRALTSERWTG
jgi:hypothetical protein